MRRLAVIALFALGGCKATNDYLRKPLYLGPTDPMAKVIDGINENNSRVPSLWSHGDFEASIVDHGKKNFINGTINLIYRRPNELLLVAKKDVAGRVFEIGSNNDRYWLLVHGDVDTMWWGTHSRVADVDATQMPINPELLLDVLGVGVIETNLKQPPVPVMRFNNDADAYMLLWNMPSSDRWTAQREVWYDRSTKLPVKVILYDANGRAVLRADLSKHKALSDPAIASNAVEPPMVASMYRLYFPDTGSTMSFELDEVATHRDAVPNDKTFSFPTAERAGVSHMKQVDEHAAMR